ncbi:hypothetical protein [Archangium sp.]|uniref:hypothetical protein n=1 Tax=Archangium sp. TaxID=1872627 RepID=UPI00286A9C0A|nr:hypothetical protein [Archangium sp.]
MGWLENVIIEDKEIDNERLELADKNALYFLGSNLTLRQCTVVLKVPASRLHILGVRFIDCTFEVKQELKNHDWSRAFLQGCRFMGRLSGCDFGHRLPLTEGRENGGIEDCDFSEARLDGCRFHGCDPRTLRFPKWPCFTVLDPIGRSRELNSAPWPGSFLPIYMEGQFTEPPSTMAVTFFAPAEAKMYDTTPEAFRAVIEKFDCIVY